MTSENMPTRVAMPCPFADEGDVASIGDTTGNTINFKDGFPEVYSTPPSANGKLVQRDEVNALGKVATQNQFYHQCGGINTFDATFASKIGGYPKGAVLKYLNGDNIYDVISLIDENEVDFTSVGVDGVNWRFLNVPYDTPSNEIMLSSFNVGPFTTGVVRTEVSSYTTNFFQQLGTIRIPKNGLLFVNTTAFALASGDDLLNNVIYNDPHVNGIRGGSIVACKVVDNSVTPPSATSIGNWTALAITGGIDVYASSLSLQSSQTIWQLNNIAMIPVSANEIYAIGVIYGGTLFYIESGIGQNNYILHLTQGILCGSPSDTSSKISFNVSLLT